MWLLINPIYGVNIRTPPAVAKSLMRSRSTPCHLSRVHMREFMNIRWGQVYISSTSKGRGRDAKGLTHNATHDT